MSAPLSSLAIERASFPVADCPTCGQRALVYLHVDEAGAESQRCVGCDTALEPTPTGWVIATPRTLEQLGYVFQHRVTAELKARGLSGCGAKGVKSCGSGGCSSGSCGTGGGCSSGGCGSR